VAAPVRTRCRPQLRLFRGAVASSPRHCRRPRCRRDRAPCAARLLHPRRGLAEAVVALSMHRRARHHARADIAAAPRRGIFRRCTLRALCAAAVACRLPRPSRAGLQVAVASSSSLPTPSPLRPSCCPPRLCRVLLVLLLLLPLQLAPRRRRRRPCPWPLQLRVHRAAARRGPRRREEGARSATPMQRLRPRKVPLPSQTTLPPPRRCAASVALPAVRRPRSGRWRRRAVSRPARPPRPPPPPLACLPPAALRPSK